MSGADAPADEFSLRPSEEEIAQNHAFRERFEAAPELLEAAPSAVARTAEEIAARVSDAGHDLILHFEVGGRAYYDKTYCRPCRPPDPSGITIGIGYDLGYYKPQDFAQDWQSLLSPEDYDCLKGTIGATSGAAEAMRGAVQHIVIPWEAAVSVYRKVTVPRFGTLMLGIYPGADALHPHCFSSLLSLVFNRGSKLSGDGRAEMRNIKSHIADGRLDRIPGELRAMKRLWPDITGLRRRRDAEANLFEQGLVAAERERRLTRPDALAATPSVVTGPGSGNGSGAGLGTLASRDRPIEAPASLEARASLEAMAGAPPAGDGDGDALPDDAYEAKAPPPFNPLEAVPEWAKVHWVKDDSVSTEYRHVLAADRERLDEAVFAFSAEDLKLLISANHFRLLLDREKRVIFALRGTVLNNEPAQPDERLAQINRHSLRLRVTRPNHQHFRCVIGVWNTETDMVSGFIASTVPNRAIVHSYANGGNAGNMLATGAYRYRVGAHSKGRYKGCLRQDEESAVLRSRDNLFYNTADAWDVRSDPMPMDNIHPAFGDNTGSSEFSSFGCQVIRGRFEDDAYTQEFAKFRQALGLRAPGTDNDRLFSYVLLTGLDAAIASDLRKSRRDTDHIALRESLVRIRQGSQGDVVRRLEAALRLKVDGHFSALDKQALAKEQRRRDGPLAGDGVFTPAIDRNWGTGVFADPAVVSTAPPIVVSGLAAGGALETAGGSGQDGLEAVYYEIGRRAGLARSEPSLLTAPALPHYEAVTLESWASAVAMGRAIAGRVERTLHELVCGDGTGDKADRQKVHDALATAVEHGPRALVAAVATVLTGWLLLPPIVAAPVAEIIVTRVWGAISAETGSAVAARMTGMCVAWGHALYPAPQLSAAAPQTARAERPMAQPGSGSQVQARGETPRPGAELAQAASETAAGRLI